MGKHRITKVFILLLVSIMLLQAFPVTALVNNKDNVYTNTVDTAADLADFTSYYAKNAREGLKQTPFSEDWTIDGTLARLAKPHGIGGFWQSNVDGNGAFGYVAELVYTKQQYTDFELTVDAMQVAESIGRQFAVGFGKTELGAFFVDSNNQMNAKGGAYVGVERNGHTSLWGYAANTVDASGGMKNNGRVSGTLVTGGSASSTWHTIKVRVENEKVSMWIKAKGAEDSAYQQVLNNVVLKNYQGGYISLMANANAAFDNLSITALTSTLPAVEVMEDLQVAQGTPISELGLPTTVKVSHQGTDYSVPVTFSCDTYNADVPGEYLFCGQLNLAGFDILSGYDLEVSLKVIVVAPEDTEGQIRISFDSARDLADFASYYSKNAKEGLKATPWNEDWTVSGSLARLAKPHGIGGFWQSNVDGNGAYGYVAEMVYTKQQFLDFELTVDAMQVAESIGRQFAVGFGKTELGAFFVDGSNQMNAKGGAYVGVERNGHTSLWGYASNTVDAVTGTIVNNGRVSGTMVSGGSASSTWHTVKVRVENGKVSMWIKAKGAEDSAYQQVLNNVVLKNYRGGYISLMTNANAAFDNLVIKEITPAKPIVEEFEDLQVDLGTALSAIPLPETVKVSYRGTDYNVPVIFSCSGYNADVPGEYLFRGELDLEGFEELAGHELNVSLKVCVVKPIDPDSLTSFSFDNAEDLKGFTAYYADNARLGYEESAVGENWEITSDGVLKRIKPAGKEFWWTNAGIDSASGVPTYEKYGVGAAEFGMVANLVYMEKTYVNFVLDVDVKCPADITRPVMIGFGQTPGKFFLDTQNIMHQEGGLYAYLSKSGETALFGYAQNTVNGANGQSGNNSRVLGKKVNYVSGTWVHLQVQVEGQNAKLYVNGELVCEAALKGYFGGYISLATSAGAQFDNLQIIDNGDGCVGTITGVEKISQQTVSTGISPGSYSLPSHVMVTTDIGRKISVPVEWSCENFSLYEAGNYTFTGKLSVGQAKLRNPNNLTATVCVEVKMAEIGSKTVTITFDDMACLDAFTSTYALDASKNGNFAEADPKEYWQISDGMLSRLEQQFHYQPNADFNKVASLTYSARTYKEFELNVDYVHGTMTYKWPMVAFGQDKAGSFAMEDGGGIIAYVEREGVPVLWGEVYEGNSRRNRDESDRYPGYYMKDTAGNVLTHHMRLVVAGGYVYFYVDHYDPVVYQLPNSYDGGYISLIANNNVKFDNLMITDLSETQEQKVVSVERFDGIVLDGLVELPRFVSVTTDQGYEYSCPVTWKSPDYSRTRAGTYNFIGTLTMPFKNLKNPDNVQALIKVKYTIDYNPGKTIKFYFDHESDLRQFELFYARSVDSGFTVMDPKSKFRLTEDGWLYRINEDFSRNKTPKDEQTDKIAILTYKGGAYKDFELNVDIKNGTKTYFWAMIGFGQTVPGTFVTEDGGGYYAYTEKEGRPIFWGNELQNANQEKNRIRPPTLWYDGFKPTEEHHLRLVVYDGIASLYVDHYNVPLVAKLSEDYIGGYISLVCGANDVSYDNLSITPLLPKEPAEHTDEEAYDLLALGTGLPEEEVPETEPVAPTEPDENTTDSGNLQKQIVKYILLWCLISLAGILLIVLIIILGTKKSGKEGKS